VREGKYKRKLSDYLMRGGLYIEIGFEYKEFFRRFEKKEERLGPVKIPRHHLQVNTTPEILGMQD